MIRIRKRKGRKEKHTVFSQKKKTRTKTQKRRLGKSTINRR